MAANLKLRPSKTRPKSNQETPPKLQNTNIKCNLLIPSIKKTLWYGTISTIAFACYVNSLQFDLVHDDVFAIKDNKDVHANNSILDVFKNDFWGKPMSSNTSHKSYRPVCVLTFRLNFGIHGLSPFGYHLVNVVLHVLVCLVFVYVADKIVLKSFDLAVVAGLLFATHPVHTEAVTGVVGRADVLACLLFLISLLFFIRSTATENSNLGKRLNMLGCVIIGGMAMLVKEQGITVFGVCIMYDVFVINKLWKRIWNGSWPPVFIHSLKPFISRTAFLTAVVICLMAFRIWMLGGNLPRFIKQDNPASFSVSFSTRIMTFCFLYAFNVWLLLSPSKLCYDWQGGSIPLVETVWDSRNLATILFFIVTGLLAYHSLLSRKAQEEDQSTVFIGLILIVIPFLPASNVFFRVGFVVAERILYIPSLGFCLLVTHGLNKLAGYSESKNQMTQSTKLLKENKKGWSAKLATLGLFVLMALFCCKTIKRNEVWKNRETLFKSGVETLPHNAKVHYNYGNFLKDMNKDEEAIKHYRISLELEPDHVSAHNNLGTLLDNSTEEAIKHFELAIKYDPMHANSYFNLGVRYGNQNKLEKAEKMLKEALRLNPRYVDAMMNLAGILSEQNKLDESESYYKHVLVLSPDNADGYNNYGVFLAKIGKTNEALNAYQQAIHLNTNHSVAYVNMGRLLKGAGQADQAEKAYKTALSIKREESTLQLLGVLYYNQDRLSDAQLAWNEALNMNPANDETLSNMGILMSKQGRHAEAVRLAKLALKQNPNKPDHYKNLASALEQSGQIGEAIDIVYSALTKFKSADLYFHHGNLLKDMNNMNDAKQSFLKAVELDPKHSIAHMHLGVILHMEKNYPEARKHYETALSLDPHNTILQQNLAKLKRLQARHSKK